MRRICLDTAESDFWDEFDRDTDRMMRELPVSKSEHVKVVRTPNGNLVQPVAR
jgi:hypothetical protein